MSGRHIGHLEYTCLVLKMSTLFVRTLREDPADAEVASHKLLVRGGYIRRVAPGIYTWLPLGLEVLRKVEQVVREEMNASGAQEVLFPALLPREPYEATGRWSEYGPTLFKLKDRKDADYLLAPTHEEMFTLLVKDLYSSYKDLPTTLYQIQTKYRDEARPRAGVIRGREFVMKDAYSFDIDDAGLDVSYQTMRDAYEKIFTRLGLPYAICSAMSGAMGGSRSEEFLFPCAIGEDTFVRSPGGYTANTEAVTTPAQPEQDASDAPAPEIVDTPDATTIDSLVQVCNDLRPREGQPWQASDTLKNVVVVAIQPDGTRELAIIGLPGDRDVDMKRVEASLAPAEVEMAGPEDLKDFPELVPGYIGPQVIGPQSARRNEDDDAVLRYYLDPHVARGSRRITGANHLNQHVFNLVYGRDFEADGFIEAAEVRAGDEAPDGSGPLEIARGIEIGHRGVVAHLPPGHPRPDGQHAKNGHRLRQAADGQAVHRFLELGHEGARVDPAEGAALGRRTVLGVLPRQRFEGAAAAFDLRAHVGQALLRQFGAELRRRARTRRRTGVKAGLRPSVPPARPGRPPCAA